MGGREQFRRIKSPTARTFYRSGCDEEDKSEAADDAEGHTDNLRRQSGSVLRDKATPIRGVQEGASGVRVGGRFEGFSEKIWSD